MRACVQRVTRAQVTVGPEVTGSIEQGLVVLLGVGHDDSDKDIQYLADKIVNLRIFADEDGKMNRSLRDTAGEIIAVPQFTLYGSTKKGRRPSFARAALPKDAAEMFALFVGVLRGTGVPVQTGGFGAHMEVDLVNDGPVTFILDLASSA